MFRRLSSVAYTVVLLVAMSAAGWYGMRRNELLACPARYEGDNYLAYCQAGNYGDYDYGAFWYGLEPDARAAAANASVLFLGNSRMQFGLSTKATREWFGGRAASFYLLGFAYDGNQAFAGPLLQRIRPRARAYVINVDLFFEDSLTPPARLILRDSSVMPRYQRKKAWQRIHRGICQRWRALCGTHAVFVRSRGTGAWIVDGGPFRPGGVSYEAGVDTSALRRYVATGRQFVSRLPADRACIILTYVPSDRGEYKTSVATAHALADSLRLPIFAPQLDGLRTFDHSHLDQPSAERFSSAMLTMAGPSLDRCLRDTH